MKKYCYKAYVYAYFRYIYVNETDINNEIQLPVRSGLHFSLFHFEIHHGGVIF